ncbi:hypothetical protein P280DRAFT_464786 [Massarina eburnea CBS 473.64]|uniref:Thymidylate kinase n=1 Tax=Massarina eburnea CBS 473.64 TaxID=1395130 RepID=A0A6A6SK61_9PLEO|nr:hypothetical protein P280DRAFT_464786 [Massarina eburnea CBS 473.64]
MALSTRQPFGEIGTPRLHALQSAKNRQNAATPFASPLKPTSTHSAGKRARPSTFDDDAADAENIDPSLSNSPTKKSKFTASSTKNDAGWIKPAKFSLVSTPSSAHSSALKPSSSASSVRKSRSSASSTTSTPISHSRGSPKHKRVGLLSKRRTSAAPFRRVDPPSSTQPSPAGLPFSIDAALSGTIRNYTPKSTVSTPAAAPITSTLKQEAKPVEESMPKGWFFEIHEDTPEQEAANLMEHSASVLDISSEDDFETKQLNEDRGKENVPPPEWTLAQQQSQATSTSELNASAQHVKLPRLRKIAQDVMDEDRKPLGDLPAAEFYGEGCDASSYVTVDPGLSKPSGLSKEFELDCETPEEKKGKAAETAVEEDAEEEEKKEVEEPIQVFSDEQEEVAPTSEVSSEVAPEASSEPEATVIEAL